MDEIIPVNRVHASYQYLKSFISGCNSGKLHAITYHRSAREVHFISKWTPDTMYVVQGLTDEQDAELEFELNRVGMIHAISMEPMETETESLHDVLTEFANYLEEITDPTRTSLDAKTLAVLNVLIGFNTMSIATDAEQASIGFEMLKASVPQLDQAMRSASKWTLGFPYPAGSKPS